MLTGDNKLAAHKVASEIGIQHVFSDLLPEDKLNILDTIRNKFGDVAMVGDGINDAPAIKQADVGIAIGRGTDIAVDAAEVVLMKNSLIDVVAAIKLGRATLRIIKQNLFWAFCYNIIAIPVAAGAFYSFGIPALPPGICSALMAVSSLTVILNAARLKGIKL
jgi:Cu+-exporting ATPase